MGELSAADIAAVNHPGYGYNDGYGFGNGSGIWLFAILALMWGGNGLFGNRGAGALERCATVEDINNSTNFARLESQVQGGFGGINERLTSLGNGICSLGYELASKFGNTDRQIAECCCSINRNIDGVRYENAINTANINANTTAGIQKILDKLCQTENDTLRSRVNLLEMQNLVQPPRAIPAYTVCNPYTGGYAGNYGNYSYGCGCGC